MTENVSTPELSRKPRKIYKRQPLYERFWSKVQMAGPDDCWGWTASKTRDGYGQLTVGGKTLYAHRVGYAVQFGPIPPDMHVLHKCDSPPCVNPDHLRLGTHKDNMADMVAKGRSSSAIQGGKCKRGHAFVPKNMYENKHGERVCRLCANIRSATYHRERYSRDPEYRERQAIRKRQARAQRRAEKQRPMGEGA